MGKDTAESSIGDIQQQMIDERLAHDPNQQPVTVHFLDTTKHIFYVPKKANGSELFDKVIGFLNLNEKDYFALSFTNGDGNRHWLYEDKRIAKQLKGRPWDFNFEVKFYPPEPATLNDDFTRHLLSLQVRRDVSTGKLPATLATYALLGSYVAQSVRGDYESSMDYLDFLRSCYLAPFPNETLFEKVKELHKQHKGKTPAEADLHYLEVAKKLSMYGVHFFPAKDGKNVPVQIGVCAHGINVYRDQIRVHRFFWQNIIKIAYRRSVFLVRVKPGELEKNESTIALKTPDHDSAERVWKNAVEHHTFFRLIQPEQKPSKGLLRWGSAKFRYHGRTQFQSKMASQMFSNQSIQRSSSAHLMRNDDVLALKNQSLPLNSLHFGNSMSGLNSSQSSSPEKTYTARITENVQKREDSTLTNGTEVGNSSAYGGITSGKPHIGIHPYATVPTTASTVGSVITSTTHHSFDHEIPAHSPLFHFSRQSAQTVRDTAITAEQQLSGDGVVHGQLSPRLVNMSHSETDGSDMHKERDMQFIPIQDTAVVYHPGHYEKEVFGNRNGPLCEPPTEPGDDFVLVYEPKLGTTGKIFHENGSETNILVREKDIETYPMRYFTNVYHSGFSKFSSGNKDIDVFEREKCLGNDDIVDERKVNMINYSTNEIFTGNVLRTERKSELPTEPLRTHVYVYNEGHYDGLDPSRTDIDEKGNFRYWLSGFLKCEKFSGQLRDQNSAVNDFEGNVLARDIRGSSNSDKEPCESVKSKQTYRIFTQPKEVKTNYTGSQICGLSSAFHERPLYNLKREEEHSFSPLYEHVKVYHPGTSVVKSKKQTKLLSRKDSGTSSETSSDGEVYISGRHKRTAIFHISAATEKRPVNEEKEFIITSHGKAVVDSREQKKLNKYSAANDAKSASGEDEQNEICEEEKKIRLCSNKDQVKAVSSDTPKMSDTVLERDKESKESLQTMVSKYRVLAVGKSVKDVEKVKPPIPPKKPLIRCVEESTLPLEKLSRTNEVIFQPLCLSLKYSDRNRPSEIKNFRRAIHKGTAEFIAKGDVSSENYKLDLNAYQDPLQKITRAKELEFSPICEHSAVYHSGNSYAKSHKTHGQKNMLELQKIAGSDISDVRGMRSHLKEEDCNLEFVNEEENVRNEINSKLETEKATVQNESDHGHPPVQQSNYSAKAFVKLEEWKNSLHSNEKKSLSKNFTYGGDTGMVEHSHIKHETYQLCTEPHDGALSCLMYEYELPFIPLKKYFPICPELYYKDVEKVEESSSASTLSRKTFSDSSTSSDSNLYVKEIHAKSKNKAILHMNSGNFYGERSDVRDVEQSDGLISFWRRSGCDKKENTNLEMKKQKPDSSSKSHTGHSQCSSMDNFRVNNEASKLQGISSISLKSSKHEARNGSTKISANLHLKEPLEVTEPSEKDGEQENSNFFFGGSSKKESGADSRISDTLSKSFSVESSDKIIHPDSLNQEAILDSVKDSNKQRTSPVVTQANVVHMSIVKDIPYQPLRTKISIQHDESIVTKKLQIDGTNDNILPEENVPVVVENPHESPRDNYEDFGYTARIMTKPQMDRDSQPRQEYHKLQTERTNDSEKSAATTSSFKLKRVHLREPPSDSSEATMAHANIGNMLKGSAISETGKVGITEVVKDGNEVIRNKKMAILQIRNDELIESNVNHKESTKSSGGSGGCSSLASFWHGHKPKNVDEQQVEHKTHIRENRESGAKSLKLELPYGKKFQVQQHEISSSPTDIKAFKSVINEQIPSRTVVAEVAEQNSVPTYDFFCVQKFGADIENTEYFTSPDEQDRKKKVAPAVSKGRSLSDGSTSPDNQIAVSDVSSGIKEWKENTFLPLSKNCEVVAMDRDHTQLPDAAEQQTPKDEVFVSEVLWEKFDAPNLKKGKQQHMGPDLLVNEEGYRDVVGDFESSDEPYKFTQTPPDIPTHVVNAADTKGPCGFVEQLKRQVSQVVAKASPSLDKKKKLKRESRLDKNVSKRGSEISFTSYTGSVLHNDSATFNQEDVNNPDAVNILSYEEAEFDAMHKSSESCVDTTYHVKEAVADNTLHGTTVDGHDMTIGPETVASDNDYQGSAIKKTVQGRQALNATQKQIYAVPDQNGVSGMHVTETTQKPVKPDDVYVSSKLLPTTDTHGLELADEWKSGTNVTDEKDFPDIPGKLVSRRTITQGSRTIETIVYKTEENGVIEIHVEHRVTIQSTENIDHDAELTQAIMEATNMNPDMTVEKIEVKEESQC